MKGIRHKSKSSASSDRSPPTASHRSRKRVGLDQLRLTKLPSELLERIPLALN